MLGITLTGRVVDRADVIESDVERRLTEQLAILETETTDQLVVVTVPSLQGRSIESFSLDLARGWGIGRAHLDNGVLLIVAPADRRVRIEVGEGLEGLLTDQRAAQIIAGMLPEFRSQKMSAGIQRGADEIQAVLVSDRRRPQRIEAQRKAA